MILKQAVWDAIHTPPVNDLGPTEITRTSGVAPLSVQFGAGYSAPYDSLGTFHSINFYWTFGDPASGTWGTNGRSKNVAHGPIAQHVFDEPGVYEVSLLAVDWTGTVVSESYEITVSDPDTYFAGTNTICVSSTGDFTGAPTGALQLTTTDLVTDLTALVVADRRILFRRGDSWSIVGMNFTPTAGLVQFGAYGAGTGEDGQGIFSNAPEITITADGNFCDMDQCQNYTIMDISFVGTGIVGGITSGTSNMQRCLYYRLKSTGFNVAIGWTHYNDSELLTIQQMDVISCDLSDTYNVVTYTGGEYCAYMGNICADSSTTHVIRIWQMYKGVIQHNRSSGSSIDNLNGRQALKLHGPGDRSDTGGDVEYGTPVPGTPLLGNHTEQVVISDNVFGASGPWPVSVGPQDFTDDCLMYNILYERNRQLADYGTYNNRDVTRGMDVWCSCFTVRNNVFDGSNRGGDYEGIVIGAAGQRNPTNHVAIINNTIFMSTNTTGNLRRGIVIGTDGLDVSVQNNLYSFPNATVPIIEYVDDGVGNSQNNNDRVDDPLYVDSENVNPLARNYAIVTGSGAENLGVRTTNHDDFNNVERATTTPDIGAFEI